MRFIHVACLKEWLKSKNTVKELPHGSIVFFKVVHCELCHQVFPESLFDYGERIEILEIPKPSECAYLVLEVLGLPVGRSFYVIKFETKHQLKIGRGHESDVRVADISVSRCHSLMRYDSQNNEIWLHDY